jgi:hypothetical protein
VVALGPAACASEGVDRRTVSESELLPALRATGYEIRVRAVRHPDGDYVLAATAFGPKATRVDFVVALGPKRLPRTELGPTLVKGKTSGTANGNFVLLVADEKVPRRNRGTHASMAVAIEQALYSQAPDLQSGP